MNDICNIVRIADKIIEIAGKENIKFNEPLKYHTSFKIGGPADIFVMPDGISAFVELLKLCKIQNIPYYIIGNGTNLIVRDKGIRGVVIKTGDKLGKCSVNNNIIEAESGILLSVLSKIACNYELSGLEFASGIPGTLGGAVIMNAGAYGGEMRDVVIKTQYLDSEGDIKVLEGQQHLFGYRTSLIQKENGVILKSWLRLKRGEKRLIEEEMQVLKDKREKSQPLDMPSAGSVFKRPKGHYTGPLIEQCGLKGYSIGGAQVSNKHCGFIVNTGDAAAEDVIGLIKFVQDTVKKQFGVELETEVKIIGEE
ncbi:MAG TPA: UDP-N-acetylmuramate dehydrogenase [Clostridiales bacterium]|nr:UDP-N-acetylmuramate dehydrogenase [Clostridiales bacterium]